MTHCWTLFYYTTVPLAFPAVLSIRTERMPHYKTDLGHSSVNSLWHHIQATFSLWALVFLTFCEHSTNCHSRYNTL